MLLYTIFSATYIVHTCSTVVLHLGILTITYELYISGKTLKINKFSYGKSSHLYFLNFFNSTCNAKVPSKPYSA